MKKSILVMVSIFALGACGGVPQGTYNAQVLKTKTAESRAAELEKKLQDTEKQLASLKSENGTLQRDSDSSNKKIAELTRESVRIRGELSRMMSAAPKICSFGSTSNNQDQKKCTEVRAFVKFAPRSVFRVAPNMMEMRTDKSLEKTIKPILLNSGKIISDCYLKANLRARKNSTSHFEFSFSVGKNGKATNPVVSHKYKMNGAALRCLKNSMKKLVFGKTERDFTANYGVSFNIISKPLMGCTIKKPVKKVKKAKKVKVRKAKVVKKKKPVKKTKKVKKTK
ncbi:MAG: hypothetical protein JXR95_15625 [Deltaproteobacteria bacterium]|nr:hypothetical protein [Deltaproteobacteria bacterium]